MVTLYDQFGRPVETPSRPLEGRIAAVSIWDRWSSYPSRGLTPEKLAAILKEADAGDVGRQAELFSEMEEKDSHLAAILQTRRTAVVGLPRSVQPYSQDDKDKEVAGFVEECLEALDMEEVILDLMDAIGKGFSICEIIWDVSDKVRPASVQWVPQQRFVWDGYEIRLLADDAPAGVRLPPWKFIVHRYKARSGLPSRAGMLRVCAWAYLFKNYAIKDWVAFAEVYGMPLRLGKYDPGASKEDREALETAVRMLGSDAAGIIANTTDIEFVEAGKTGAEVYERLVEYCDRAMSKAILGQTLTTDTTGATGTYAAGAVHEMVRRDLLEADAAAIAKTIQRDLIKPIVGWNFGWERVSRLPYIQFDTSEPEDLRATAETYATLVEKVGLPISYEHIYERFGIPPPESDDTLVATRPLQAVPHKAIPLAMATRVIQESSPLDMLVKASAKEAAGVVDDMLSPLRRIVEEARDYDDLVNRLMVEYQDLDTAALQELIARAIFMAELGGMADV